MTPPKKSNRGFAVTPPEPWPEPGKPREDLATLISRGQSRFPRRPIDWREIREGIGGYVGPALIGIALALWLIARDWK
jgi:hypothetical protein